MLFYVLAHMAVRSQEMRLIAQSMAEVAMRLAEPETVARESIVTVGQAIRRARRGRNNRFARRCGRWRCFLRVRDTGQSQRRNHHAAKHSTFPSRRRLPRRAAPRKYAAACFKMIAATAMDAVQGAFSRQTAAHCDEAANACDG